jgi:hypothetical protein
MTLHSTDGAGVELESLRSQSRFAISATRAASDKLPSIVDEIKFAMLRS